MRAAKMLSKSGAHRVSPSASRCDGTSCSVGVKGGANAGPSVCKQSFEHSSSNNQNGSRMYCDYGSDPDVVFYRVTTAITRQPGQERQTFTVA